MNYGFLGWDIYNTFSKKEHNFHETIVDVNFFV